MDNIEEKLIKFEENCIKMSKEEATNIEMKIKDEIFDTINKETKKYENEIKVAIDKKIVKLEKQYNIKIYEINQKLKQEIIEEENAIKENIKDEVKKMLKEYTISNEYEEYLLKNIKNALDCIKKEGSIVYLTSTDYEKYKENIENKFNNVKVKSMEDFYLGGCKIENDDLKIIIDNTFKSLINENITKI